MATFASEAALTASYIGTVAQSPNDPSITIGGVGPGMGMNRKPTIRIAKSVAAAIAAYRTRFVGTERRISFLPARTDRVPLIVPLTRPCSPIRPFTRPVGVTRPLTRPTPFTRPFVRPSPFTRPFTRPRPLTRPFTFPAPRVVVFGRAPLTSPLVPRIQPVRNPTAGGTGDGSAGAFASSRFATAALIVASTPIVSSSSSMSQSRTAAFVSSSSSGLRDFSNSPTRRSSTRMSNSGAPPGAGLASGSGGAATKRAPHDGQSATFLGTVEPHLGHVGPSSERRSSSCAISCSHATSSRSAGADVEVMQPQSGHAYWSWAIASLVRRGGVYLMRGRDESILCAATGPTSGIRANSSTEVRAIFQRASYPRSISACARDGSRPRTFSRWTREAGSDSPLMRRFGRPAAGGTAGAAAGGDRSPSAAGGREREGDWAQINRQGVWAPHLGDGGPRSGWRG